ncbi:MAG: penicillin-binding protein 2 [Vicinamibacteria bacterium]|nr:penicillin-binding protein 2 [Vicinamibacteria bacterium]
MKIYEDLRGVQARIGVIQYMLVITIGILLSVLWYIQVLRGHLFRNLAENNQRRVITIAAPRGPMVDRNGQLLVENRPAFRIVLRPEDCPDLDETIGRLSRLLQTAESRIRESVALRPAPFRPVVIKANASNRDLAMIRARRIELPQVQVDPAPLRFYPLTAAAHVLGRVGEITERQLHSKDFEGLSAGSLVGQMGLEATYNSQLMGKDGYRRVIVNSRGLEVQEAERIEALEGPTLKLTINYELQKELESAFAGRSGCGIVLDPRNGDVLALVSLPAYDPNLFAAGISPLEWSRLINDDKTPLMNRAIQGQYSPGSLFKIVVAAAALEEGIITPKTNFFCSGQINMYGTVFHCHKADGHGAVDLHKALAQSCNVFFFQVGSQLEIGRIARYAKRLGLGTPTGIDLPYEVGGLVPTPEWKLGLFKTPWYAGETVSVAIGQGQILVTPIQMARLIAAIANGGRLVRPRLIRSIGGRSIPIEAPVNVGLSPDTLNAIRAGLSAVVNQGGTGRRARLTGVEVCGKTGSAQIVARAKLREDSPLEFQPHAWFIGFAPANDPRIAFAILVEHGVGGSRSAAPLAHEVLSHIFHGATISKS